MRTLPLFGQPLPALPAEAWSVLIILFSFARPVRRCADPAPRTASSPAVDVEDHAPRAPSMRPSG
jgi:hypothetical protein